MKECMNLGEFETMSVLYPELIDVLCREGEPVSPDFKPTLELLDVSFTINNIVGGGVPIGVGRKVGTKPMAVDGFQNLAGRAYPDVALASGPFLARFSDPLREEDPPAVKWRSGRASDGPFFQGAYGPRMNRGLLLAAQALKTDPYTRRAVINLWDEDTDMLTGYKDRPCTTQLQFLIRNGRLHLFATMRSNDVWTGTCYDPWQFGQVQQAMAHVLNVECGPYHHRAVSMHMYLSDWDKAKGIRPGIFNEREDAGPDWSALPQGTYKYMADVSSAFRTIGDSLHDGQYPIPLSTVEAWYIDHLQAVMIHA